ncbi:TetR/AcrR family transcriptional regulator [Spirosoma soli]|uniref:TetR/AcrR family transcriptional regulator n=1 Tax=Spirosoma soli TaxID=1770529 RepID=A0ABW5LZ65_9BACT
MPLKPLTALKARKSPRQARSEATVDAIFEATIQVLISQGVQRMTTTRVAERAGVSVGTMYQYFPHKEALLYAVIERYLGEVANAVEACCQENVGQSIALASDALVSAYISAKSKHAEASRALYLASAELAVADLVNSVFDRFQDSTTRLLSSVPDARFQDIDGVAFTLLASLTGATRVVFENSPTPETIEKFRQRMMAMCRAFLQDASDKPSTEAQ